MLSTAKFLSVTLDEATAVDVTSWMSVHMYVVVDWSREPLFIKVGECEKIQACN